MVAVPQSMSESEYLALDRQSDIRHEYVDGHVLAMSGASWYHNLICTNISSRLNGLLKDKPCYVLASDMRIKTLARSYRYPDVVVICGEPQFIDERSDTVTNPQVLIEVLSPSTALIDRNEKLREYRQFSTLQEYLIVAQSEARVERFVRQDEQNWLYTDIGGMESSVTIPSLSCTLPLAEIYSKVVFQGSG